MPKKAKKVKIRKKWQINPRTRVKKSKKRYSRKNKKKVVDREVKIWAS